MSVRAIAEGAHELAVRGAEASARAELLLAPDTPLERAWTVAARAALLDPPADLAAQVAALAPQAALPIGYALVHLARHAALRGILEPAQAALSALGEVDGDAAAQLARAWLAWARGEALVDDELAALERRAREQERAFLVVDAALLRALCADASGDAPTMLASARRGSRMARAEGLPLWECIAHLVLARARRMNRAPHLALRILGSLERVAPPALRPWISWEALLSGDPTLARTWPSAGESERGLGAVADAATQALASARCGDRAAFDASAARALAAVALAPWMARELEELLAALDARRSPSPSLATWASARSILPPASVHGLCAGLVLVPAGEGEEEAEALLVASAAAPPRRVLGVAAALHQSPGVAVFKRSRRKQSRVETLIAVLVCAGAAGLSEEDCFRQTYELDFEPEVHRAVFDMLIMRARAHVGDAARITKGQGGIALELATPVLVPDPRCAAPSHDRLLRVLARQGRATASDAAQHSGLSLRAAQEALKALTEDGVCEAVKQGRQIIYSVEDTTFSDATERSARERTGHS